MPTSEHAPVLFCAGDGLPWESVADGVRRQVLAYGPELMLVKVAFEAGAVGAEHQHPHAQTSYVESGAFEYTIAGATRVLRTGDSCFVPGNTLHGTTCLESGVLLDSFSPLREDFLQ
ncbi:cupin domain-containing protein [Hymenobacter jeollabukensis]|uniref:Cupin domain-containing protein n=1 Tax=Hymenobacter jeollabukensis TaxID=2025313 RepID=A0A5R8WRH7_9BACT|nr:cupin domain-containing protein [Hymenobacter jeollabukensis]TLM93063.1 cupin domain-containing protein [Hymenobacter jeollabukensis]